jgi:branched-chain amino acid transport system ATP-binding protein
VTSIPPRSRGGIDDGSPILAARGITKRFGGVAANDSIDLSMAAGECLGLIGPNGSGKTTFINLVGGAYRPDAGELCSRGVSIAGLRPHRIAALGIARTFQNFRLFLRMTARDNVVAGALLKDNRMHACKQVADEVLAWVGLSAKADAPAESLSTGQRKRLEVARCLATKPDLLILDEPLAGVDPGNRAPIIGLLTRLRAEFDLSVLLVEHDPNVIRQLCDRVVVLDRGRVLAEGSTSHVYADHAVRAAYLDPQHVA